VSVCSKATTPLVHLVNCKQENHTNQQERIVMFNLLPVVAANLAPPGLATQISREWPFQVVGIILTILVTVIGIRMILYWTSFTFQSNRYRQRVPVSVADLKHLAENHRIPYLKVQFTTKGSPGSSEVIMRGLRQLEELAVEDPGFYAGFLTAEVVTENDEQAELISSRFDYSPLARVDCVTTPKDYKAPKGTQLKAKQMHYLVSLRRAGWNRRPGRTFIVHFDEDTLMIPSEFRKMIKVLTLTDKKVLTGPIYYPLEYDDASKLARATEATRPITCFECRRVMETGVPLHVHGSNLVVEEELENRLGWDIGLMPGKKGKPDSPFVAEDYMFGMDAFLKEGREVFGWHGCVAWEQPPFSFPSVYGQRYRWVFGVLQGMSVSTVLPEFHSLPWHLQIKVIWGTRYRIATYALGTMVGILSLLFLPWALLVIGLQLRASETAGVSPWLDAWFSIVGFMWLGSGILGAWMNALHTGRSDSGIMIEALRGIVFSPFAGFMENMAAMSAVVKWMLGTRNMVWNTTPSTKAADDALHGKTKVVQQPLAETVIEATLPDHRTGKRLPLVPLTIGGILVISCYIGVPVLLVIQSALHTDGIAAPAMLAIIVITLVMAGVFLRVDKLTTPDAAQHRRQQTALASAPTVTMEIANLLSTGTTNYDEAFMQRVRNTAPLKALEE
jgi:hypothetical protein